MWVRSSRLHRLYNGINMNMPNCTQNLRRCHFTVPKRIRMSLKRMECSKSKHTWTPWFGLNQSIPKGIQIAIYILAWKGLALIEDSLPQLQRKQRIDSCFTQWGLRKQMIKIRRKRASSTESQQVSYMTVCFNFSFMTSPLRNSSNFFFFNFQLLSVSLYGAVLA